MTVDQWLRILDGLFPPALAESWDNVGLQVGDRSWEAGRVLVALDPTGGVIGEAVEAGCGLLVTHHPLPFRPLERLDLNETTGRALAGAGVIGQYTHCSFRVGGIGTFLPSERANPVIGERGSLTEVEEDRLEMVLPATRLEAAVQALRAAHPYEEVAYDVYPLVARDRPTGRVALCGGAGAFLIPDALAAEADVFVTGDVKHHQALDAAAAGLTVIDAGHHGTEWPFVGALARVLSNAIPGAEVSVSGTSTDPLTGWRHGGATSSPGATSTRPARSWRRPRSRWGSSAWPSTRSPLRNGAWSTMSLRSSSGSPRSRAGCTTAAWPTRRSCRRSRPRSPGSNRGSRGSRTRSSGRWSVARSSRDDCRRSRQS